MADIMAQKDYDLTEITRLLLNLRDNCVPKAGDAYEDPERAEKYDALNAAIDLINNPSLLQKWISVEDMLPEDCIDQSKDIKTIKVLVAIKAKNGWTVRTQTRYKSTCGGRYGEPLKVTWFWGRFSAGEVTHWMPPPETPKEKISRDD